MRRHQAEGSPQNALRSASRQPNFSVMDENERKEVDANLVKAEIQLLFEGDPELRKAIPDLFCKACNGKGIKVSAKNKDDLPSSATKVCGILVCV